MGFRPLAVVQHFGEHAVEPVKRGGTPLSQVQQVGILAALFNDLGRLLQKAHQLHHFVSPLIR